MDLNERIFSHQKKIYSEENTGQAAGEKSRAPKFHTFGVRNKKSRMDWYREEDPIQKLHLKDRHRSTMGRAAGEYFARMFQTTTA